MSFTLAIKPTPFIIKSKYNTIKKNSQSTVKPKSGFVKEKFDAYLVKAEKINGRAAMIGFSSAVVEEMVTHQPIMNQFMDNIGLAVCVMSLVVVGTASNPKDEAYLWGLFDERAEKWNGRAAMIGIISLLITETAKNPPIPLF